MPLYGFFSVAERCRDSQFEHEHHVGAVFVHVVQLYDVGVPELLQDVHLPLDLLSLHTPPADPTLAFFDELGGVLVVGGLLFTSLDNCKLPTAVKEIK